MNASEIFDDCFPKWTPSVPPFLPDGRPQTAHMEPSNVGPRYWTNRHGETRLLPHPKYERAVTPSGAVITMVVRTTRVGNTASMRMYEQDKITQKRSQGFLTIDLPPHGQSLEEWHRYCLSEREKRLAKSEADCKRRAKVKDKNFAAVEQLAEKIVQGNQAALAEVARMMHEPAPEKRPRGG